MILGGRLTVPTMTKNPKMWATKTDRNLFKTKNLKSPTQYKLKKQNQDGNGLPCGEPWNYVRGIGPKQKDEDLENDI